MSLTIILILLSLFASVPQNSVNTQSSFDEGCCLDKKDFPHPKHPLRKDLQQPLLLLALNCATHNRFIGTSEQVAHSMGTNDNLEIAYFYGHYMPEQDRDALTIGVYSRDGQRGFLFDILWERDGSYSVGNIPDLLRARSHWRVGGIDGGIWSYTRLYYLAQDLGRMPKIQVSLAEVVANKPAACWVMGEKQWDDTRQQKQR